MIIDNIRNAENYYGINENLTKALKCLKESDFSGDPKRYEIDGKKAYASLYNCTKNTLENSKWEAHKLYGDIHMVVEGEEYFGYDYRVEDSENLEYNENGDRVYDAEGGNFVTLLPGDFIVVFPQEPHMPIVTFKEGEKVKKVIAKFTME